MASWHRRALRADRALIAAATVLSTAACSAPPAADTRDTVSTRAIATATSAVAVDSSAFEYDVDTLARGLEVPWGIAMLPDGRLLVTERAGRIVAIHPETGALTPWASLDVYAREAGIGPEAGLMGIAIAPDFASSRDVYVVATTWRSDGDRRRALTTRLWRRLAGRIDPHAALRYRNQVLRLRDQDGRGEAPEILVEDIPTAHYHAGGAISVGPDNALYVTAGDALLPDRIDRGGATHARVLRFTRAGGEPADNPVVGSPDWARGLRNAQGLAWLPDSSLLAIEHGPTGMPHEAGRGGHDELNQIHRAADYGWPRVIGDVSIDGSALPLLTWPQPIAPAGIAVYHGPIAEWSGSVLVAGLRGVLERLTLERQQAQWVVVGRQRLLDGQFGRLRAVAVDDHGRILLTSSNRDARGAPRSGDDLLVRLTPRQNRRVGSREHGATASREYRVGSTE